MTMMGNTHLQKPLTPRKGLLQGQTRRWFDLKKTKGKRNKNLLEERIREIRIGANKGWIRLTCLSR